MKNLTPDKGFFEEISEICDIFKVHTKRKRRDRYAYKI